MMEVNSATLAHIPQLKMEPPFLPPGFRFHPLDYELVENYLKRKVFDANFKVRHIGEVDLNRSEPWDLPGMARMGESKEWYFFAVRDRKYPTGKRANRATKAGYWKATGKDKEVVRSRSGSCNSSCTVVGMKKTLVFYKGRAPRGEKTNWIMHEYRLLMDPSAREQYSHYEYRSNLPKDSEWVICRIFKKNPGGKISSASIFRTCKLEKENEDEANEIRTIPLHEFPLRPASTTNDLGIADDDLSSQRIQHINDDQEARTEFGSQDYQNALYNIDSKSSSIQSIHALWDWPYISPNDEDAAQLIDSTNCDSVSRSEPISDSFFNFNSTYNQHDPYHCISLQGAACNFEVNNNVDSMNGFSRIQLNPPITACPLPFEPNTSVSAGWALKELSKSPSKATLDSQSNFIEMGDFPKQCKVEMLDIPEDDRPLGMNSQRLYVADQIGDSSDEDNMITC